MHGIYWESQKPAQRMIDFTKKRVSSDIPKTSYVRNHFSWNGSGFPNFNKHITWRFYRIWIDRGYLTNEAAHAPESRTSSPVRIKRSTNVWTSSNKRPVVKRSGLWRNNFGSYWWRKMHYDWRHLNQKKSLLKRISINFGNIIFYVFEEFLPIFLNIKLNLSDKISWLYANDRNSPLLKSSIDCLFFKS
jgi:hypothetical protein